MTSPQRGEADIAEAAALDAPRLVAAICPYLIAEDGSWRAARPLREHRCHAVAPRALPSLEKQRRLCLVYEHVHCPAFMTARETLARGRGTALEGSSAFDDRLASRIPRSVPVALDRPSAIAGPLAGIGGTRQAARLGLVAIMLAAGGVLVAARFLGGTLTGSPEATASAAATVSPSPAPTPTTLPTPSPAPTPTTLPTPPPASTPVPTPSPPAPERTYRVRSGDTLSSVAIRFHTTVAILQALNGIADPRLIHTGQVLRIP